MSRKIGLIVLVVLALSLSACERSASSGPTATPAKNNFPQPEATTAMGVVEIAASQTAAALTGVPLGTPALAIDDSTATATPLGGGLPDLSTATATGLAGLPTLSGADTALPSVTPDLGGLITDTPQPAQPTIQTVRPTSYTLQEGDFVFCLARRFNVDPAQILSLNGLVDSETLYPGRTLQIPTTGSFPGTRALKAHPATYIVLTGDTIYSIACQYGDVDPLNIAAVNSLTAPYTLTVGAQLQIP